MEDRDDLTSGLLALLGARDWPAAFAAIDAHPVLLTEPARERLRTLSAEVDEPDVRGQAERMLQVLADCKTRGLAAVQQEMLMGAVPQGVPAEDADRRTAAEQSAPADLLADLQPGDGNAAQADALTFARRILAQEEQFASPAGVAGLVLRGAAGVALAEAAGEDRTWLEAAADQLNSVLNELAPAHEPCVFGSCAHSYGKILDELSDYDKTETKLFEALKLYQKAQEIHTYEHHPQKWTKIQINYANSLLKLGRRTGRADYFQEASDVLQQLLNNFSNQLTLVDRAKAQNCLGIVYFELGVRTPGTNFFDKARSSWQIATECFNKSGYRLESAVTSTNIANALLLTNQRNGDYLQSEQIIDLYTNALKEIERKALPKKWANIQNNLGCIYEQIAEHTGDRKYFERAIQSYKAALEVRTREEMPIDWAWMQNNLCQVYTSFGEISSEKNFSTLQ